MTVTGRLFGAMGALLRRRLAQPGWAEHERLWRAAFLDRLAKEASRPSRQRLVEDLANGVSRMDSRQIAILPADYPFNDAELAIYVPMARARYRLLSDWQRANRESYSPSLSPALYLDDDVKPDPFEYDFPKPSIWS